VELGESVREAAARELREECGLEVQLHSQLYIQLYIQLSRKWKS